MTLIFSNPVPLNDPGSDGFQKTLEQIYGHAPRGSPVSLFVIKAPNPHLKRPPDQRPPDPPELTTPAQPHLTLGPCSPKPLPWIPAKLIVFVVY